MPTQRPEVFQYVNPASGCTKCPALVRDRHHVVWGSGPEKSDILFLGEAPGYNEDQVGLPLVGAAGREAGKMVWEAGAAWVDIAVRNRMMCRPPGNRDPDAREMAACEPWLWQNMRMVNPKLIVCFGRYAQALMFSGMHQVHEVEGLMYRWVCFGCGGMDMQHLGRYASDGVWVQQAYNHCSIQMTKVLVAAIYHPASVIGGKNPENRQRIVEQLKRAINELHVMQRTE